MNSTTYSILVPIGFSEQSMIALEQAERLATLTNGEITLLSVIETSGMLSRLFGEDEEKYSDLKIVLQEKLDKLATEVSARIGLKVNAMASKGKVSQKIIEVSELISAKLIVMGTNGAPSEFSKKVIGSNAFRVITHSTCPVITIKGKDHFKGCRNIILPLDLEKETKEKVSHALKLARIWGATVKVVSISKNKDDEARAKLKANLNQVKRFLTDGGVTTEAELIKAEGRSLAQSILDYSNDNEGDLIMIMTQQESDFTDHFIGSSAQSIVYNTDTPVMSVRPVVTIGSIYDLP
jgi:nucleotide-binding universal stress UspA family protein